MLCETSVQVLTIIPECLEEQLRLSSTAMAHSISEARSSEAQRIPEESRCMLLAVFAPEQHELQRASQTIQLAKMMKCLMSSFFKNTALGHHSWRTSHIHFLE